MKNTLIVILSLLVIGLCSFLIFDKIIDKNINNKTNKSDNTTKQNNIDDSTQSSDTESNIDNQSIDYNSLVGVWYENDLAKDYPNSNQLTIKSVDNNKLVLDMYFTRTAGFTDAVVQLRENTGEFESVSDNGVNDSGELGNAKFKIVINEDTIKLIILQTDIHYLKPAEYTFTYVDKNGNKLKNYNIDEIKDIVISISLEENGDPIIKKYTIEDREEMKIILSSLDDAQSIGIAQDGVGLEGLMSLDINRYQDPTTRVVFLQNGNVLIGSIGVGDSRYGEYKISNTNLKNYIEKKYFNR